MGPHQGRAEWGRTSLDLLTTLLMMHSRCHWPSWQPGHTAGLPGARLSPATSYQHPGLRFTCPFFQTISRCQKRSPSRRPYEKQFLKIQLRVLHCSSPPPAVWLHPKIVDSKVTNTHEESALRAKWAPSEAQTSPTLTHRSTLSAPARSQPGVVGRAPARSSTGSGKRSSSFSHAHLLPQVLI